MLRLLCSSITSIYPLIFRSLSASRTPTIATATTTALPPRPRTFSVDSSRYAKRTTTPPRQKRPSTQPHKHNKAQQDTGASKKKKKSELRALLRAKREALPAKREVLRAKREVLRAKREALQQQVKREREEKAGEKKGGKPGAAEKKRIIKELLKEKKEKKMEEKRFAKEVKETDRYLSVKRRRSGSPEKGAWAQVNKRAGWGLEEARASSPVAGGRMRARSPEVSQSRGTPVSRGTPSRNIPWMREQGSKMGGRNAGNMVPDNDILFSENNPWKYPEKEDDEPRRGKAPPGKKERERMRLRHSRERSASMTRRDWASSLERRASPSRKTDLKEKLRAVRLPPELMQRERDGRSASPHRDQSLSNSISSRGREAGFREGSLTQRRGIHTSASSSYSYGGQSWREEWESRDDDRERWDDYRKGREDYGRGRRGYGGGYTGRNDYRGGRQGYRDDYRQVRKGQDEEEGGVSLKGHLHSPSHFPGGNRYRPPPSALAYQSHNPPRQQKPIPETGIKSYEDQQGSYYQNEVEQQRRQRDTYTRTHSPIAVRQQGQYTSQRQYQKEWCPEERSSLTQPPPAPTELIPTALRAEPASLPRYQKECYSERGRYEPKSQLAYQHFQPEDHHSRQPLPFHDLHRPLHHHPTFPTPTLPTPVPTPEYLHCASHQPNALPPNSSPNPILIILDLNGALLHRSRGSKATQSSKRPHPRPYLTQFLNYLFAHFSVMVWSSALPANVASMVAAAFTPEQRERLVAVWGRDTLGLSKEQMYAKVVVYKRLEKVWESVGLSKGGKRGGVWSQANTVLVDDSAVKASAQPFNLVEISTWEGGQDGAKDRELLEVAGYLEKMRRGKWVDVSAWMRMRPFRKGEWGEEVGSWFWGEEAKVDEVDEGKEVLEGVEESGNKKKRMRRKARARALKQEEKKARAGRGECAGEGELDSEIDMGMGSNEVLDVGVDVGGEVEVDVPVPEEDAKIIETQEDYTPTDVVDDNGEKIVVVPNEPIEVSVPN